MNAEYVIETRQLSKQYRKHKAVNRVDLHVKKGSIYGLIGKNGAGKTTIMKMICGLASQTEGEVILFGGNEENKDLVYKRIGMLIENPGLYPGMNAYDNLKCKALCMGISNYSEKICEILELVGLERTGGKAVKKFSLGMKQRLGIALALIGEPDVLVLDEPINGLDPQGIAEIREMLVKLNQEKNITILISSHILEELSKIVTDYGIIRDGKLVEEISKEELMEKCLERIEIKTTNVDKATTILENMDIQNYKVLDNETIHVYEKLEQIKEINKQLVMEDVDVMSIMINNESIENYFFQLTGK
ncbi:MAG: ATP-binding cassette domain-containing protein [Lachnospiraceae bacterium]|nr:ATP-binding cassette domain-containing protein [Lachnospiraceae bacterium]